MATLLENYRDLKKFLNTKINEKEITPSLVCHYTELLYRIQILENFWMFSKTAPVSTDLSILASHYQMFDTFSEHLLQERKFKKTDNPELQKRQEAVYKSFVSVVQDYRKRFSHYSPSTETQYKTDILNVISVVLPVWLQYRSTYINFD